MDIWQIIVSFGIPSAIVSVFGWLFKKKLDKRDARLQQQQIETEKLMLFIIQNSRANTILSTAIAKAVQRIPDAKCNGDMTTALEQAEKIFKEEKEFLFNLGVKHIFEE